MDWIQRMVEGQRRAIARRVRSRHIAGFLQAVDQWLNAPTGDFWEMRSAWLLTVEQRIIVEMPCDSFAGIWRTPDDLLRDQLNLCRLFQMRGRLQRATPPPSAPAVIMQGPRVPPPGYYESKHWHDHAAAQRRAWNYECALNASHTGPVEVHHRTYERVGREEERDTLPLCAECHERHHGHMPHQRPLLKKAA